MSNRTEKTKRNALQSDPPVCQKQSPRIPLTQWEKIGASYRKTWEISKQLQSLGELLEATLPEHSTAFSETMGLGLLLTSLAEQLAEIPKTLETVSLSLAAYIEPSDSE